MVAGHTSRFLVIWVAFLPFTLYNTCRWATVPISAIVAFLLLGIEEIGVNIEEPFSILPLGEHTTRAQISILTSEEIKSGLLEECDS